MNLRSEDQIKDAIERDLVDTVGAIVERVELPDQGSIVALAGETLIENGVTDVVAFSSQWKSGLTAVPIRTCAH
jgi:hypothetical protein